MLQQSFHITVDSEDSAGLAGAMLAIKECKELIAEHVDRCEVEVSDIATISE